MRQIANVQSPIVVASMGSARQRTKSPSHLLVTASLALFAIHVALAYPGIMTWDSKMQYGQALSGVLTDWHPPIMAALWRLLLPISTGGSGLFILHLATYWEALAVVASAVANAGRVGTAMGVLALGLFPPAFLLATFIHKDVGFAAALLLAFGIAFSCRLAGRRPGRRETIAMLLALAYATLVRSNGVFGVAPIAIYAFRPVGLDKRWKLTRMAALSAALVAIAIPVGTLINRHVFRAADAKSALSVILYDLAGVAHEARSTGIYPVRPPSLDAVDRCYDDFFWDPINKGACAVTVGPFDGVPNSLKAKAWPVAILSHPRAYALHRLHHFNQELFAFVPPRQWQWPEFPDFQDLPRGRLEAPTFRATSYLSMFPLTTPAAMLVLALATMCVTAVDPSIDARWREAGLYLSFAAATYTLGFGVVGVASMYRYHQFLLTAAPLAAILAVAGARSDRRRGTAAAIVGPALVMAGAIAAFRGLAL